MATRFVRIDLSDTGRDYRPIAVEPGVGMLDRSGSNNRILFRWLGGMIADPVWEGESVNFFVRDDHGGRLEDAVCQPASEQDLRTTLKDDVAKLKERIEKAAAETSTERTLRKVLARTFQEQAEDPGRHDQDSYFFKYRDVQGNWRLTWCWGYQRADQQPAPAVVCTDPDCNLLFVRKQGQSPKCPSCFGAPVPRRKRSKTNWSRVALLALLLLLLLGGFLWLMLRPGELIAKPKELNGEVGAELDLHVEQGHSLFGFPFWQKDVTREAEASGLDSKIAKFDPETGKVALLTPGETTIHLQRRGREADIKLVSTAKSGTLAQTPPPVAEAIKELIKEHGDIESVKILSEDGQSVRFPAGARFKDYRVEAKFKDGFTKLATKKALYHMPESPGEAYVTASNGALVGVRPGKTKVDAEYGNVKSTVPLDVEVTASVDVDKLVVSAPSPIRPGETLPMQVIGYKDGKSAGDISGLANITCQSDNEDVARVSGSSITGMKVGQANVTAKIGNVASAATPVVVADQIADDLRLDPKEGIVLRVGEGVQIGEGLNIFRGNADVSRECAVKPLAPGFVRYLPETHSLIGIAPGSVPVSFAVGDKELTRQVTVVPTGGAITGRVVIEPEVLKLAPGQMEQPRVYVVTSSGDKIDRTSSAALRSSDPDVVKVEGDRICALKPGAVEIKAAVSGPEKAGSASVQVVDEPIGSIRISPDYLRDLSLGDRRYLHIYGTAPTAGEHELFPQGDLKAGTSGKDPNCVRLTGSQQLDAATTGEASLDVAYRDKLKSSVPVKVSNNVLSDLRIEPGQITLRPGEALAYKVTAMKGGDRVVLGPENGVQLAVGDQRVATVIDGMNVGAQSPGTTAVVARVGDQKAEARLDVSGDAVVVRSPVDETYVYRPGARIYRDNGTVVEHYHGHDHVVGPDGVVIERGPDTVTETAPRTVTGLRFKPDILNMGTNAQPALVRVFEVLDNGADGLEVTADPKLELSGLSDVAKLDKTNEGPVIQPVKPGTSRVNAGLGDLKSVAPMLVNIGGEDLTGSLVVAPNPLTVWAGETTKFGSVRVDPGNNQPSFPIEFKLGLPADQKNVKVEPDGGLTGLAAGTVQGMVTSTDPKYPNLSAPVTIQVTTPEKLAIDPDTLDLQVGQKTGMINVVARDADGKTVQVPAMLESMDEKILAPEPATPGQFVAKAQGQTKLRATYRGGEALATVSITGKRFVDVKAAINTEGKDDFDVNIAVQAAGSEGELEYRVYAAGQTPGENWVSNQPDGDARKVTLPSPRLGYKPHGEMYQLVVEARDKAGKTVEQYPLTFGLRGVVYHPGSGEKPPAPKEPQP